MLWNPCEAGKTDWSAVMLWLQSQCSIITFWLANHSEGQYENVWTGYTMNYLVGNVKYSGVVRW